MTYDCTSPKAKCFFLTRRTVRLGRNIRARVELEHAARQLTLQLWTSSAGPRWHFIQTLNVATARELGTALLHLADLVEGGAA